jgi:phage-related baseplate assembly protein
MADLIKKDIRYLGKDFNSIKANLIDFSKTYFPNTYQDFNEASPGMMFLEMAAYVGDVLSYYTDATLQESMITHAIERQNVLNIAQSMGYKPKNRVAAVVKLDVFQIVPSIQDENGTLVPDWNYALAIEEGMIVASDISTATIRFRTVDYLDFKYSSSMDPTEVTPFEVNDANGTVDFWLLKKSVNAISGVINTKTFTFQSPQPYTKIILNEPNLIEIIDATDSDGNRWYHVPFLAQDTLFEPVPNIPRNDKFLTKDRDQAPYLLKLRRVPRRFTSRQTAEDVFEIQFGSGVSNLDDEILIPNPDLISGGLNNIGNNISNELNPANFLYTKTYGLAPNNTTLTFRYTVGGGPQDNVPSDTITRLLSRSILADETGLDSTLLSQVINSLAVTNANPSTGGKIGEDIEEIRQNALAHFASQNRAVTKEDYILRAYSLPAKYGSIAKAYVTKDIDIKYNASNNNEVIPNQLGISFYLLGYNSNGNLIPINETTKENLKTYLDQYRIMTDGISIKDAYVINIGIEFEIVTLPNQNGNQVVLRCINKLKDYFDIKKWQINQPIVMSNIYTELDRVEGVQTVVNVRIINKHNESMGYSKNVYDIQNATKDGIIFPSLDPSIFEIRFPDNDIFGKSRSF